MVDSVSIAFLSCSHTFRHSNLQCFASQFRDFESTTADRLRSYSNVARDGDCAVAAGDGMLRHVDTVVKKYNPPCNDFLLLHEITTIDSLIVASGL